MQADRPDRSVEKASSLRSKDRSHLAAPARPNPHQNHLLDAGVTEAAGKLQDAGLIQYRRGRISVLDRPGVEGRSCECYQMVKTEFDRLLPYVAK